MLSSRSLTAYRFATAERPVLPADRARVLRWRVHRASPAAPGRRRGRSRRMDLVRHREWRGAADRPGRHAHREDGEGRRLHARARLPRQHGSVLLRQPGGHGLPARSRVGPRRALRKPGHQDSQLSGRRCYAATAPRLRQPRFRGAGAGRVCVRPRDRRGRSLVRRRAGVRQWAGARARRQCALRL